MFDKFLNHITWLPDWFYDIPDWALLIALGAIGYYTACLIGRMLWAIIASPWKEHYKDER